MIDTEECLFCKIVKKEIPAEVIYDDANFLCFLDINPRNPGHALVIPKKHYETIMDMPEGEVGDLMLMVRKIAAAIKETMKADGISVGQSNGRAAGQVIPHVHFHVIPRYLSEGPPGLESIVPVKKLPPETMKKAAEMIRPNVGKSISSSPPKSSGKPKKPKLDDDFDF